MAPTPGAGLLTLSPVVAFLAAAAVAGGAGVSAQALERRLPDASRLTPQPQPQPQPQRAATAGQWAHKQAQ